MEALTATSCLLSKMIACNRKTKGRGVSIFVKNKKRWQLISKLSNIQCQALTVRFKLNDLNVLVTTIYVKPNNSINNFFDDIQDYLDNIQFRPKNREKLAINIKDCHFLCGDVNVDHSKPNNREEL